MSRAAAALALLLPIAAAAQQGHPVNRAGISHERSHLDNGSPDWTATTLQLSRHWSNRQVAEAELTRTRRFGLDDTEWALGGSLPLGPDLTGSLRVTHSPTHRVLPRDSVTASLQYEIRKAWLLHGGLKRTRYATTDVEQASLGLEHYFGNWSAHGAVHFARAFGERTETGELRLNWYYADESFAGVILSSGDEAGQVGPGAIALARVKSVALVGRHAFAGGPWALRWSLHHVQQGDFYTRSGGSLGVQVSF